MKYFKNLYHNYNIIFFILLIINTIFFVNCTSFNQSLLKEKFYIHQKYNDYKVIVNQESLKANFPNSHYSNKYRKQIVQIIQNNLQPRKIKNINSPKGYISVIIRSIKTDENRWLYLNALFFPLSIMGLPTHTFHVTIDLDISVFNQEGKIIKTFETQGLRKVKNGLYYGKWDITWGNDKPGDSSFAKTAIFMALKRALIDARIELSNVNSFKPKGIK